MSEVEDAENQNVLLENFLLGNKEYISTHNAGIMDAENSQELGVIKQGGHQMNTLSQFRSSSTLTVCPSPQLVPSPHAGSQSVPPYFPHYASPSPTYPASPATATSHSVLGSSSTFQFNRTLNKKSPLRVLSDSEGSYRTSLSKQGHLKLLQRSLSSTPTKATSAYANGSLSSLLKRRITTDNSPLGLNHSVEGLRSASLSPYSIHPVDVNHNLVPDDALFSNNQNQTTQSHFLLRSPSTILNPMLEQHCSQESISAQSSPHNMLSNINSSPAATAQSNSALGGPSDQQQSVAFLSIGSHSPNPMTGNSRSPRATLGGEQDNEPSNCKSPRDSSEDQTDPTQALPVTSFAQSYTNLTPWTTRLVSDSHNSIPNINDETLPLTLGISDNLLLSASAKENQPEQQESYSVLNQPYSSLEQSSSDSDGSWSKPTKDTYKIMPNKQLRFRKTADALQKSGLWEVAMKTGSLIRRNKELQKELDKFRADALIFLKSVIKNPHNWKLIKSILSNALSSNQATNKASPIMTVVVSAAEAAAAAAVKLDSAGSTDGSNSSSSMCGNVSDSSGHNSDTSSETNLVDKHFASTKHGFSCVGMAMDVN